MCDSTPVKEKDAVCGRNYLVNMNNGVAIVHECNFPKAKISVSRNEWISEQCVFHTSGNEEELNGRAPDGCSLNEIDTELHKLRVSAIEAVFVPDSGLPSFERLGTQEFPIVNHTFESLQAEGMVSENPICLEECTINGPVFFKNCEFTTLNLGLKKGNILTLTQCKIAAINLHREDEEPERIYLNNTQVGALRANVPEFENIRLENSTIQAFTVENFTPFKGRIVSIGSKLNFLGGDFSSATVGVADKISFNRSVVRGCLFLTKNFDEWRRLKLTYNQNSSILAFILLLTFLLPIAFDLAYWQAVAGLQDAIENSTAFRDYPNLSVCLAENCKKIRLLWLIFGANQGAFYIAMTTALLILNVLRVVIVSECAIIREWEDQSGLYPEKGTVFPRSIIKVGPESDGLGEWRLTYGRLIPLDWIVRTLLYVSIISVGVNMFNTYNTIVSLPVKL